MRILVTGGAGYIGSITTKRLIDLGYMVIVVDSLERGNAWAVHPKAEFIKGNLLDKKFIDRIFSKHYDGVIHFAGYIVAEESVEKPELYFKNNLVSALNVLEGMTVGRSDNLVFSSSAGVYGNPPQKNSYSGKFRMPADKSLQRNEVNN